MAWASATATRQNSMPWSANADPTATSISALCPATARPESAGLVQQSVCGREVDMGLSTYCRALEPLAASAWRLSNGSCRRMRALEKKADHLARGVWPLGVGIRPRRAAARPCVSSAMNDPHLEHRSIARVEVAGSAVGASTCTPAFCHRAQPSRAGRAKLLDDVVAVSQMHGRVLVSMEHNGRDEPAIPVERRRTR